MYNGTGLVASLARYFVERDIGKYGEEPLVRCVVEICRTHHIKFPKEELKEVRSGIEDGKKRNWEVIEFEDITGKQMPHPITDYLKNELANKLYREKNRFTALCNSF